MAEIIVPVELIGRLMKRGWLVFSTREAAEASLESVNARAQEKLGVEIYTAIKEHPDGTQFAVRTEDDIYGELTDAERMALVPVLSDDWEPAINYEG